MDRLMIVTDLATGLDEIVNVEVEKRDISTSWSEIFATHYGPTSQTEPHWEGRTALAEEDNYSEESYP